jgi:hypothetical protein
MQDQCQRHDSQIERCERIGVFVRVSGEKQRKAIEKVAESCDDAGDGCQEANQEYVHDTFHTAMLCELDSNGKTTADVFEIINLRLAQSVTARNALGCDPEDNSREIATMVYGEVRPDGLFRFVSFGHPPPLVFSAEFGKFMEIGWSRMVQFPSLGLEIPEDHPDRSRYVSITLRKSQMTSFDSDEITLMSRGDILFL